jgi:hypothetical protein
LKGAKSASSIEQIAQIVAIMQAEAKKNQPELA